MYENLHNIHLEFSTFTRTQIQMDIMYRKPMFKSEFSRFQMYEYI